jgi:Na+/H+-dicarboxylate symporter
MELLKMKLHTQIVLALILGAIFGAIFHIDKNLLEISFVEGGIQKSEQIQNWKSFAFVSDKPTEFSAKDQLLIIQKFKSLTLEERKQTKINIDNKIFENVQSVEKVETIAIYIKPVGDIFIRLLTMIAIPLVLASLIVGAASLGDIKRLARIGGKTISIYLFTTALAITVGLVLANLVQPGTRMPESTKQELLATYQSDVSKKIQTEVDVDVMTQIVNLVPRNPIKAMADAEMLQIVFFALLAGIALTFVKKDKQQTVVNFFDGLSDTMIKLVDLIMKVAPYGVFALIAATVGEFGFEILQTLIWYSLTVLIGLFIHTVFIYGVMLKLFSRMKVRTFFKGIRRAQTIAFSTSSSAATLPVNMECCEENLGISKRITSFTLPLGATINMDGTALYQGVAAVFIAQVYGMDLGIIEQLMIVLTAVLASIGTAPVPGVGIIMLIIVLKAVHVPEEGIALILGVDRILDMCRTIMNITGDAAVSVVVAQSEGELKKPDLSQA